MRPRFIFAMANTFTALHYHIIFFTKHREPWIRPEIQERVWAYLGGVAREYDMHAILIGGMQDHVHMALTISPSLSISKALQLIKGASSAWIKETFPGMQGFAWQDGYGAFTVSKSNLNTVTEYIQNQPTHHRTQTFQEEYLAFLQRHEVDYNPRYLWD